jgi:gamma-glutamylcyclotransferase (GGCT)/AIG2-like uncharacterized protein YtfP
MPLLFSYGSLQQESVQVSTFGRLLPGTRDELPMFERSFVEIEDPKIVAATGETHYANARFTGSDGDRLAGAVFDITDAELAAADLYEANASYKRIRAKTASGKQVWVYVDARSVPPRGSK